VDEAAWEASSPREKALISGVTDWVDLGQIHSYVERSNPGASLAAIQAETLDLIRALADEGLVRIGDLTGPGGRFVAWSTSLEESLQRIRSVCREIRRSRQLAVLLLAGPHRRR
jgi:hypothetical protein